MCKVDYVLMGTYTLTWCIEIGKRRYETKFARTSNSSGKYTVPWRRPNKSYPTMKLPNNRVRAKSRVPKATSDPIAQFLSNVGE